jgi:ABC-type uncharacterized transport system substrate-binding protein
MTRHALLLVLATAATAATAPAAHAKKCFFVNSYHAGYEWSDGIVRGAEKGLKGKCDFEVFYMDTKRNKAGSEKMAAEAKAKTEAMHPDVVITSDDNAVKFLLQPSYKNAKIPFIYTGVNWSGEAYGLPYKNTTGMIEVAPVQAIVQELKNASRTLKTATFVSADNESEQMDYKYTSKLFAAAGIQMKSKLVKNFAEWKTAFKEAQESSDVVYVNNNAGIADWNDAEAKAFATENIKKLTTGIYEWMLPCATFVMMKNPEEQGAFAASAAIQIMDGKAPSSIREVKNHEYTPAVNVALAKKSPFPLGEGLMNKAKKLE